MRLTLHMVSRCQGCGRVVGYVAPAGRCWWCEEDHRRAAAVGGLAEEFFELAVQAEQDRDDALGCLSLALACLQDAEAENEELRRPVERANTDCHQQLDKTRAWKWNCEEARAQCVRLEREIERLRKALDSQRQLHASNCVAWQGSVQKHHDEACGYKAQADRAVGLLRELRDDYSWCPYTRWTGKVEALLDGERDGD